MKKFISFSISVAVLFFFTALIINPVSAQSTANSGSGKSTIPENIMKIAERSCVHCHADPGNSMAQAHVNLSKWDAYSPKKQASKAKAMCKMVTKGKMPPGNFRKEHPGAAPTKDEIKIICDWANSL